jgi:hypothetical protein
VLMVREVAHGPEAEQAPSGESLTT